MAHCWQRLLEDGKYRSLAEIAAEGIDRGQASRIAQLARGTGYCERLHVSRSTLLKIGGVESVLSHQYVGRSNSAYFKWTAMSALGSILATRSRHGHGRLQTLSRNWICLSASSKPVVQGCP